MKNKSLVIAGTLPPPIGGVTIHVNRLIELLKANKINYDLVDLRANGNKFNFLSYLKRMINMIKKSSGGILHYQLNNWNEAGIIALIAPLFHIKMIYTVHSYTQKIDGLNLVSKLLFNICKRNIEIFIAPSKTIKVSLLRDGVLSSKITVINTFLPPSRGEIDKKIPREIISFISGKEKIIVANAYKLYLNNDGIDIYGLDMCIEACAKLENIKFIFCCPIIEDQVYYEKCKIKISKLRLEDRFLIFNQNISLVSLFRHCNIFVRPTATDGYGISVEEALYLGVVAIASDVCERTNGTVLFSNRNIEDFIAKIRMCLDNEYYIEYHTSECKLLKLYKCILNGVIYADE